MKLPGWMVNLRVSFEEMGKLVSAVAASFHIPTYSVRRSRALLLQQPQGDQLRAPADCPGPAAPVSSLDECSHKADEKHF